jgi:hypothetical protein
MRRAAALTVLALPAALSACGASSSASTSPAVSCQQVERSELVAVAHRIYAQAVSGRNETAAVARIQASAPLAGAVAAGNPHAVSAALAPLLKNQIVRIDISGGGRTLATAGSAAAYAPVRGAIRFGGRVVGQYVLSVGDERAFTGITGGLTGATVAFARNPAKSATTFPATTFPSGRTFVSLALPRQTRAVCGATAADTRLNTIGSVAQNLMNSEMHGSAAKQTLRHAAGNAAFRRAIAAGDPAAVWNAIVGFFRDSRFHIVRVRAWRGTRLINDVGGPYVLSPASSAIRGPSGATVGHFMLSVQDDTGFIKLVHRFTGADVVLNTAAGPVPGSNLYPGPPFATGLRTVTYRGRSYRDLGFDGTAFPSGRLHVSLLLPQAS